MRSSGYIKQEQKPEMVSVPRRQPEGNLSAPQVLELDTAYQDLLPQFSKLIIEFKQDMKRCRRSANFSGRKTWTPQARQLFTIEQMLLEGPEDKITFLKRLSVRDSKTGRMITYTCTPSDTETSQVDSSYVAVSIEAVLQFGRILSLFEHKFADKNYTWANVALYEVPTKDGDTRFWNVQGTARKNCLVPLEKLSYPLVVAVESEPQRLWFINY